MVESLPVRTRDRLELLDVYRFIAALMVVLFHYLYNGIAGGKITHVQPLGEVAQIAKYGHMGVELFFVISGFVIFNSALGKTPAQFAVGRAKRLYPAFWVALCFTTAVIIISGTGSVSPARFLANITMAAPPLGQSWVEPVYWTLLLEVKFYLLVLVVLLLRLQKKMPTLFTIWAVVLLVVQVAFPSLTPIDFLGGYYAFFAGGALIATIRLHGPRIVTVLGLGAAWAAALITTLNRIGAAEAAGRVDFSHPAVAALISSYFIAVLCLCSPRVARFRVPGSRRMGALTYPLYLVHATVGYILLDQFMTESNTWFCVPVVVVTMLAVAYLINRFVEVAPARFWSRVFDSTVGRTVNAFDGAIHRIIPARGANRAGDRSVDEIAGSA